MSWERRGKAIYYYRKRRRGGRVVSGYVGRGEEAQLAARIDGGGKRERERMRAAMRKAHAKEERADETLLEFENLVRAITRGYLIAQGCHTHKGQWRRKREKAG